MADTTEANKHDGLFAGENRDIRPVNPVAIPPNKPRPDEGATTRFVRGQPTGNL